MKPKKAAPKKRQPEKRRKSGKRRANAKAVVACKDHKPDRAEIEGSTERREALALKASHYKIRGYSLSEIADQLVGDFDLVEKPSRVTVGEWINAIQREVFREAKEEIESYIALVKTRAEAQIRKLIPFALDDFAVSRKEIVNGMEIEVIDENVLEERIKAAGEIRKTHEMVLKVMGVFKVQADGEKVSPDSMRMFVIQTVNNYIAPNGLPVSEDRRQSVLELTGGGDIDGL